MSHIKFPSAKIEDNSALCGLRWGYPVVNFGLQSVRHCCRTPIMRVTDKEVLKYKENLFLNHPYHRKRRKEMLKGVRHQDCSSCWKLEDSGMKSPRDHVKTLNRLDLISGNNSSILHNRTISTKPWMLDIELSNLCDMACMYCSRFFSSRWAAEDLKLKKITPEAARYENRSTIPEFEEYFWNWFDQIKDSLRHINFIGGEPFLQKKYFECVERINAAYENKVRKKMIFVTVSNFNTPEAQFEKVLPLLEKVSNLYSTNIDASQESFGKRAEFIRYGLSWDTWLSNVRKVLECKFPGFELGVQSALNILSLKTLPEFFEILADIRDQYNSILLLKTNIISWPTYFSPLIATEDFAQDIEKAADLVMSRHNPLLNTKFKDHGSFNWDRYSGFLRGLAHSIREKQSDLNYLNSERAKFYTWCNEYEKTRDVNFLETFPEYADFYEVCRKAHNASQLKNF